MGTISGNPMTPQLHDPLTRQHGFTLVELIMVIVLMGVIGGIVSVFMKGPIDAYFASGKRSALTDVADTTVRRMARDLHRALPNTIRSSGSCNNLEFVPTKTGGRYRTEGVGALTFSAPIGSFNMLGDPSAFVGAAVPADQTLAVGDLIVVYNLGITGSDVYASDNYSPVTTVGAVMGGPGTPETPINITPKQFPLASGSNRFHVIPGGEKIVTYICSTTNSTLYRTVGTALSATPNCSTTVSPSLSVSIIATNVNCAADGTSFAYSPTDLRRNAVVTMVLSIQDSSNTETVNLQHEVHVDNTP